SRADLPGANPADRRIDRVGAPGSHRFYAWLPRAAADQTYSITVKMIDPLGRIGTTALDVPPLDLVNPVPGQVVIPAWTTKTEVLQRDQMRLNVLRHTQLGLQDPFEFEQQPSRFGHAEEISIYPPQSRLVATCL